MIIMLVDLDSGRLLFSASSTQTGTGITSLLRFLIVSVMLLNEGMLQEIKIITLPINNTEFKIYNNI